MSDLAGALTVVCRDRTHESREAIVSRFFLYSDRTPRWEEVIARSVKLQRDGGAGEEIVPGLRVPPRADKAEAYRALNEFDVPGPLLPAGRVRYSFRCELCGVTVPVRWERLFPIFDALSEAGVPSISLRALAARLQ